jgi:hypothetical protein
MNRIQRSLAAAVLPLAALIAAPAAQAQAIDDWQHTVPACSPDGLNSLRFAQINAPAGYVRANNPDAGVLRFTCNVLDSFATSVPLWNRLVLQYRDAAGGRIMATLYEKSKLTGASVAVANAISTASGAINNVAVPAPAMNFGLNTYYIVVSIQGAVQNPPQAHTVMLTM